MGYILASCLGMVGKVLRAIVRIHVQRGVEEYLSSGELLTGVLSLDGVQSQRGVAFPPDITYSLVAFDNERRDIHGLEARSNLHARLSSTNCGKSAGVVRMRRVHICSAKTH